MASPSRFPNDIRLIFLLLYGPIGLVLLILRLAVYLQLQLAAHFIPCYYGSIRRFILQSISAVCGMLVHCSGRHQLSSNNKVIVSNHVSVMDATVLNTTLQVNRSYSKDYYPSREEFLKACKSKTELSQPILLFPERTISDGKSLLEFCDWIFETEHSVQPIVIKATRPFLGYVRLTTRTSNRWEDLLWHFFVPYTFYDIRILPVLSKDANESNDKAIFRLRKEISEALNLRSDPIVSEQSSLSASQIKKQADDGVINSDNPQTEVVQPVTPQKDSSKSPKTTTPTRDTRLAKMVQQVQDVFPQVPYDVIQKDLAITKNVDDTIAKILDGRIKYTPVTPPKKTENNEISTSPNRSLFSSKNFGRSSSERLTSLLDRREALIERARKNYRENLESKSK
ncbi:uncharacterized protein TRIADDRAFT_58610 [Trichoplax adhaerens]|uniref:Lipid droplet-regulating VLDL assembly factor AUP1 n=1 Tax=Trichoplax adhaerens TaxID=10228 RepID=B3S363_TRIAD|nr:hypothetical protein TRIADDRAFT_58610 [Trichoplax adhaerens]EDV22916.1 hypothetical protein TRIADDRAFT_58610 [Trichoplax adhaerens]|eukprot:XP_002114782.1 hypothetical protein TRIADDRAFT_58610 [Trichoplax adhaerens]